MMGQVRRSKCLAYLWTVSARTLSDAANNDTKKPLMDE